MNIEQSKIEIIEKETRAFTCPCCKAELQFLVSVLVKGVHVAGLHNEDAKLKIVKPEKSEEEILLDDLELSGVLPSFLEACEWVSNWTPPRDLRKFFLTFIKNAKRDPHVSQIELQEIIPDSKGFLDAFTFQAITMILEEGKYRRFMPHEVYKKRAVTKIRIASGEIERTRYTAQAWQKTKYGYVEGNIFCSALRLESRGSYGRATKSHRT